MYERKLMLFDGHGLAYRAFYAMPSLSNSKGVPVNAVLGMANMVLKAIETERPTHAVFFFDAGLSEERVAVYEHYKAHRERMPENLETQLSLIKQLVLLMGFPVIELPGYEADDCIGTVVEKLKNDLMEICIVTGDMDLLQLVSEKNNVLATVRGTSDMTPFTPEDVKKKFGVTPLQLADYKGLAGDSSDNIPGVSGIGPKTAADLISRFGSMENLYANLNEIDSVKVRQTLESHKEEAFLSKQLASLIKDVPVEFALDNSICPKIYPEEVGAFLDELELWNLKSRLGFSNKREVKPMKDLQSHKLSDNNVEVLEKIGEVLALTKYESNIITAFSSNEVLSVSLDECKTFFKELIARKKQLKLIVHDSKKWFKETEELEYVFENNVWHDSMLAAFLLNGSTSSPTINQVVREHLGLEVTGNYPAEESALLWKCASILEEKLQEKELMQAYRQIELPLVPVLARMERAGIALDVDYLMELSKELNRNIENIAERIYIVAGEKFNISSNKQLANILYEKLGLPQGRKTKTGYSTDSDELERLAKQYDIAIEILAHREISKLKNTYVDSLPAIVNHATGRIHSSFHQAVTATGRLSSSNPNLQNIPIRTELGRKIRRAFITRSPDYILLSLDYSQIELRVLAHMSQDQILINAFNSDMDIHTQTAAEMYAIGPDNVTLDMRRAAKAVNFGIIYGMTEHGLSQGLGISREEAKGFIARYFERFPGVKLFIQNLLEETRDCGYVKTLFGRRRYLPDITSKNRMVREMAERMAVNTPVQGTAAEIIKLAMIRIDKLLKERGYESKMIVQVHDELLFEVPKYELEKIAQMVLCEMESVVQFSIPLKVNMEVGTNWADTEPLSLAAF